LSLQDLKLALRAFDPMSRPFHLYLYGADAGPLPISFEELSLRLTQITEVHCEPDGSFCWAPTPDESIFGMIYDAAGQVQYLELRGQCGWEAWQTLIAAVGGEFAEQMVVMCLRSQQRKKLQSFEQSSWPSN